ncbi:MAG: NADH-quinone oxidoreductase subunit J [Proteobacteria bacterium]|nr:NADH-quinone oxidoreductase subunit J [Pseudomonadota bacterium]MBU2226497.1 NADH-quinone oxidoreductase subunit J [Pseudomonadota bacterium]MBU2261968.1 NADH-quinone oxidoreductase subunit J [Pseudomonadota bacterium]
MDIASFKVIVFIIAALVAVATSVLMVTRKNPVHSALWMIVTFFAVAVIYLLLNAQFIAVAQVMVYAGAIMMLILFVIMLVHMERGEEGEAGKARRSAKTRIAWALLTIVLFVEVLFGALFFRMTGRIGAYPAEMVNKVGNVKTIGSLLYGQYLFPFEIASILLLVGIVGAVVIVKRK